MLSEPREDKEWQEREEKNCQKQVRIGLGWWDEVEAEVAGLATEVSFLECLARVVLTQV